jgi:hypothetical protein
MKLSLPFFRIAAISAVVIICIVAVSCRLKKDADAAVEIPFNHKTHVETYRISDCGTCHKYNDSMMFRGLPSIGECTACHSRSGSLTSSDHMSPRKKTVFDSYTDSDRPWNSKAKDQQLLYYSHKTALTKVVDGKTVFRCEPCHGDKVSSSGTAHIKGGKLMDNCIECHTAYKLNNQCDVCHR